MNEIAPRVHCRQTEINGFVGWEVLLDRPRSERVFVQLEYEQGIAELSFPPGVVAMLWVAPEEAQNLYRFQDMMAASGGMDWTAKVTDPCYAVSEHGGTPGR